MHRSNQIAHVFGLAALAVAQPLLDVLARHPTFFVAHDVSRVELVAFAFGLVAAPTLAITAIVESLRLVSAKLASVAQAAFVGLLASAALLPLAGALGLQSGIAIVIAALAIALGAAAAYLTLPIARQFLSFVAIFGVVAPLLFLSKPTIRPLLANEPLALSGVIVKEPAPIAVVVFDGLKLVELLDQRGEIDAARFPSFARLARSSTWYRNATSVAAFTHEAVPAILTGKYPFSSASSAPSASEHAGNLFTLLGGAYDLRVYEPVTALCPSTLCDTRADDDRLRSWWRLHADAAVVWLHVVLPERVRERLPSLAGRWTGFGAPGDQRKARAFESAMASDDRSAQFLRSLEGLQPGSDLPLYFHHTLLPHDPFEHFPSGLRHGVPKERLRPTARAYDWPDDESVVHFEEGLYVLQLAYADALLGRLLDRLEQLGMQDSALVVVTADHGFAFAAGESQRRYAANTAGDIVPVPLFVKAPGQTRGTVSDAEAETIDILPTIAELIGAALPWKVDGRPLSQNLEPRTKSFVGSTRKDAITFASMKSERDQALARKLASVGSGGTPYDVLYDAGLPRSKEELASALVSAKVPYKIELRHARGRADDDPWFSRRFVDGTVVGPRAPRPGDRLLLTIDDRVVGTTEMFPSPVSQTYAFEAVVDERFLKDQTEADMQIFFWDTEARSAKRPSSVSFAPAEVEASSAAAAVVWRNVWSGSERAFACSRDVRRLFADQHRQRVAAAEPSAPYRMLESAVHDCYATSAQQASGADDQCRCDPFGKGTVSGESIASAPREGTERDAPSFASDADTDSERLWREVWDGSDDIRSCAPDVKARFARLHRTLRAGGATLILAPYEILGAAVRTCFIDSQAASDEKESSHASVESATCACGPFDAASSNTPPQFDTATARQVASTAEERSLLVTHLQRNGLR
jgi:hypothetical protein